MERAHEMDDIENLPPEEEEEEEEEEWMQELLWPPPDPRHQIALDNCNESAFLQHPSLSRNADEPEPLVNAVPASHPQQTGDSSKVKRESSNKMMQQKVALETKSDIDILDDGFKWRKYGQKSVKNSKHPRSYYRCSVLGCPVKKRVERSTLDPSLVVTTYHAMHNHHSPMAQNLDSS